MPRQRKTVPVSPEGEPLGLICRQCGCAEFFVVYRRPLRNHMMRRLECRHCGRRIVTREYER